jgi:hypothetical protein
MAPTDEEIMELMPQQMRDDLAQAARALAGFTGPNAATACRIILNRHAVDHSRAVLARWGNSQGILDSSPQVEPVEPTDEELIEPIVWMIDERVYDTDKGEIAESLRELIARWGTPANNTRGTQYDG